ncbi:hypothetical protein B0H16DRAFT_1722189 [Mycena metata]|uniref:Uncharacterized protein n=1 Tax=Mycena metata TaxID=1033252 RepID=A0AAD7J291_9AGAR|nr:hypothetical protein B0H16DRAFT_1722189 [Mycena metata]
MIPSWIKNFTKYSDATPPRSQAKKIWGTPEANQRHGEIEADRGRHPWPEGAHLGHEEPQRMDLSMPQIAGGRLDGERADAPRSLLEQPPVKVHRSELNFIPAKAGSMSGSLGPPKVEVSTSAEAQDTHRPSREGTNKQGTQSWKKSAERSEKENSDLRKDAERMRSDIFKLTAQNREYSALLAAAQDREIRWASEQFKSQGPTFGVTANATSIADVRRTMENLEAEIFQVAAALSDLDLRSRLTKGHALGGQSNYELNDRMVWVLGDELAWLLSGAGAHTPEMLVQIALQTAMSNWSFIHLRSWVPERHDDRTNAFLAELYADVRRSEEPNDALRWRAMTRKQLLQRMSPADVKASLLQHLTDVVNMTLEEPLDPGKIETEFGDRIEAAVRLLCDLNKDIGTKIVSDDLEVVFVGAGEIFESTVMENILGLQKRGDDGGHTVTLVKPKVVVRSTMRLLMTDEE